MEENERIVNIFISPKRVFLDLKEKPRWIVPFMIFSITVALTAVITINITKESVIAKQENILKEKGMDREQIEQAISIMHTPFPFVAGFLGACIATSVTLLIFATILSLLISLSGGISSFRHVFSIICYSSLVQVPANILKWIISVITKSPNVITSFVLFTPFFEKDNFFYKLLSYIDFFILWEMILVSVGINITNKIKKNNSFIIVFIIWFVSIIIQILGGLIFGK